MAIENADRDWLSLTAASKLTGFERSTLWRWYDAGKFEYTMRLEMLPQKPILIDRKSLLDVCEKHKQKRATI